MITTTNKAKEKTAARLPFRKEKKSAIQKLNTNNPETANRNTVSSVTICPLNEKSEWIAQKDKNVRFDNLFYMML